MKITKNYLRQLIRESLEEVSRKRALGAPAPREIRNNPHLVITKQEQKQEAVEKLNNLANAIKIAAGPEGAAIVKKFGNELLNNPSTLLLADIANHYDDAELPDNETRQVINKAAHDFYNLHTTAETRWKRAGMTYANLGKALAS